MAVFPGFASIIGIFLTIGLYTDGSLSNVTNNVTSVMASPTVSGAYTWEFITLIPLLFTVAAALLAGKRVSEAF